VYSQSRFAAITHTALRGARRHWMAIGIPIAVILLLAYAIAFLIDEPLRRYTENKMNHALKGYTARIGKLDFHPIGFSLDLRDVVVTQEEHPDPPVLRLERLSASVQWRALLSGKVVGDVELIRPSVYLNLPQARKEINDPTPVKERGWQDALQAVYPLKINHFEIRHGDATYIDQGPFKPLHVRDIELIATDIRNRRSDRPYPSDVRFSATVFESGRVSGDGQADLLAEPNPAFRGDIDRHLRVPRLGRDWPATGRKTRALFMFAASGSRLAGNWPQNGLQLASRIAPAADPCAGYARYAPALAGDERRIGAQGRWLQLASRIEGP
jgi:hypothetical protein